jgi:hypothetical protein
MRRLILMQMLLVAFVCTTVYAEGKGHKDGKDDVMGARWAYTLTKGEEKASGHFRVYNKEVFKGAEKVGTVKAEDEDETTIEFTSWPEMDGTAVLRKTRRKPAGATGTLTKKDGSKWDMKVVVTDA